MNNSKSEKRGKSKENFVIRKEKKKRMK